jgi:tetratricopeptide (TPR) repeat protein
MKCGVFFLLSLTVIQVHAQAEMRYIRKGNHSYNKGTFQQAEIDYRKALEKNGQSAKADYNLGNALYKQKQYEAAVSKYETLAKSGKDHQSLNRYYYNLGNALFQTKNYGKSIEAYKNALKYVPSDMDSKHNLLLAMRMQQAQQNQNNNQQNKQDQDKQNQDKNQSNQGRNPQNEQSSGEKEQSQGNQESQGQISPEDAERILQALENEEKRVVSDVQEQKTRIHSVPLERNW